MLGYKLAIFVVVFSLAVGAPLGAQGQDTLDENYRQLVASALQGKAINYTNLRLDYTKTSFYQPYGDVRIALNPFIQAGRWVEARDQVNQFIELGNFCLIDLSHSAITIFDNLNNPSASNFFQYIGEQLLNSIYTSGDGLSEATAWQVINVREPYFLLNSLNYRVLQHSSYTKEGVTFDTLLAEDIASGLQATFYFNTTLMQKATNSLP